MATTRTVFGCGYLGIRAAKLWRAAGDHIWAFTRNEYRVPELGMAGLLTAKGDVTDPQSLASLTRLTGVGGTQMSALLYAVGYDRDAGPDIHSVYAVGLSNVLSALPPSASRCIYISTTGVYGDAGGRWVDEQTPTDPLREGGRASLAAEEVLRKHPIGRRSVILRLAGIYGPDRIPYLDRFRAGEPIPAPSEGWLNLIHVDDAARVVVAADEWAAAQPDGDGPWVFCVCDGTPVQRNQYYHEIARRIGAPAPQFTAPAVNSPAAARAAANRRVRNRRMQESLAVKLRYPSYVQGLAASQLDDAGC